ncbi:MAG: cytochrome c oxidase subunit 3 [Pseudomonadota bacterium]
MAGSHATDHDYHILPPSPWPFVGSMAALLAAIGAVLWMHGGQWIWFALGMLGILYTMIMWWRDVVRESIAGDHTPVVSLHLRYGMILFIASEVMFFVAWFWAYFDAGFFPGAVEQPTRTEVLGGVWPPLGIETFDPWHLPLMNTVILLTSGTTVTWAHHAIIHGDREGFKQGLALTVALGVFFTGMQIYEYTHAHFDFAGHIYGATFFMATGFHGFHVFVGTIFLAVCLLRAMQGQFTKDKHFGFEAAAWYWHFVDVVWLFLFVAIYVWGYGGGGNF